MTIVKMVSTIVAAATVSFSIASSANAQESVLNKVKSGATLKVCFAQVTPDSYKDPKTGQWTGVFVDLLNELATWGKFKIEAVEVSFGTAPLALQQGDCDLFGASLLYNAPRALQINYIKPFAAKGVNAVARADFDKQLSKPEDLNREGLKIAVLAGSREFEIAQRQFPKATILALQVPTDLAIYDSVRRGDADVALSNGITQRWWVKLPANSWSKILFADDFSVQPNGWAIRYRDPDWKNFLDAYADWVIQNGKAKALYESYLSRTSLFSR